MALQKQISRRRLKSRVGQRLEVMIEGPSKDTDLVWEGRLEGMAPDIDGKVYITEFEGVDDAADLPAAGTMATLEVTQTKDYDLIGRVVEFASAEPRQRIAGLPPRTHFPFSPLAEPEREKRLAKLLLPIALLAATGAAGASRCARRRGRDVILSTDCGAEIDDQFAIAYLSLVPEMQLKGIVTTHAPNLPKQAQSSAECAKDVLAHLGAGPWPPIFAGSDGPLAARTPLKNAGVDFIVDGSRRYSAKNRLVIVTLGATTDVASAFLADPSMGDRVEILTMGFDDWPKGGDPWNIKNDPLAYQVILDSSAPITIGCRGR